MSEVTEIKDIEQLVKLPIQMEKPENFGELCWWRGHSIETWQIMPRVFRENKNNSLGLSYEANILKWFQSQASIRHSPLPLPDDNFAWLAIAQHYRLPTRLLDWSQSILIAAYFAVSENESNDAALWCLQPNLLNQEYLQYRGAALPHYISQLANNAFTTFLPEHCYDSQLEDNFNKNVVAAVVPNKADLRMLQQMAMFTIHTKPIALNDGENYSSYLRRFMIPKKAKKQIRRDLESLGIAAHTIFPDLENLANYLSNKNFSYLDETLRNEATEFARNEIDKTAQQEDFDKKQFEAIGEKVAESTLQQFRKNEVMILLRELVKEALKDEKKKSLR